MKKSIIVLVFLVATFVAPVFGQVVGIPGMGAVNAEWYGRQAYAPFDRIIGAVGPGGYYDGGGYGYGGGFGSGNRATTIIGGVAAGAGLGYGISGTGRGAMIGGAVGGGVVGGADYLANRAARGPKPVDCSKRKLNRKEQATCEAAVAEAQAQAELAERQLRGGKLRNATPYTLIVTDCGERVTILHPGQGARVLEAMCGYEGTMLVFSQTPGLREDRPAKFHVSDEHDGWVFNAPDIRRAAAKGGAR